MSAVAVRLRVSGRVQGVFFRDSCATEARRRGVTGWVRNEDDGTLAAHLEGGQADVEAMVEWCRVGPPRAEVSDLEREAVDPEGCDDFEVR